MHWQLIVSIVGGLIILYGAVMKTSLEIGDLMYPEWENKNRWAWRFIWVGVAIVIIAAVCNIGGI